MSNIVSIVNGEALTSTAAIAEGTGVQHKNVLELARRYESDLSDFGRVTFETRPFETAGGAQQRELALLNEQQATLLMTYMRNSSVVRDFKKRLVKAFYELASRAKSANIADLPRLDLLRMALAAEEERLALSAENESMRPKVAAFDRISTRSHGSMCITDAAKALGVKRYQLTEYLLTHGWCYRRTGKRGHLVAYHRPIEAGCLEHKVSNIETDDGPRTVQQVLVTAKGLAKLAERLAEAA